MRNMAKQLMGVFLSIVMVFGLMPGMSYTADAYEGNPFASFVSNGKKVTFGGHEWKIIKDESASVTSGTLTLLAADSSFGFCTFNDSGYDTKYSTSKIKKYLDDLTGPGGSMHNVADAIKTTIVHTATTMM